MREIKVDSITDAVARLCMQSNYNLPGDVYDALKVAETNETSEAGRDFLAHAIMNADIAREGMLPICQDTGFAVVFIEVGQDVHIIGGSLADAVNAGVANGCIEGYLRASIVCHPLDRVNTGNNTPAVIHTDIVSGDRVRITVMPKGGGSENVGAMKMMIPSDDEEAVKSFVVETVKAAGSKPCPPIIVGVGLGGIMETAASLATYALLRDMSDHSTNPRDAKLESDLLALVNNTGIGPGGLGGYVTALAVKVESYPCHIASLPVAVKIQCHVARHMEAYL